MTTDHPTTPPIYPANLADVNLTLDCGTYGHVYGLITGSMRHCERYGCLWWDALDPDEFTDRWGGLYDWDDPDRDQLGYYGPDAYILRR